MKLRNLLFVLLIVFIGSFAVSCTDESENIVPEPVQSQQESATVGHESEDDDPMD